MMTYAWAKAIPGLAGFFGVILFIHWLGPAEFGNYSLFFSLVNMCTAFSFAWFNQSIIRYYSRLEQQDQVISAVIGGWIVSSLLSILLILILQLLNFPKPGPILLLMLLSICLGSFSMSSVLFQSRLQASRVVRLNIFQALLFILCPMVSIHILGKNYQVLLFGLIFAYFLPVLWIFASKRRLVKLDIVKLFSSLGQFLSFGIPISLWFATSLSLNFLDRYFLEYYTGLESMGIYASYSEIFTRFFSLILFPITMALHPYLTKLWNQGEFNKASRYLKWGIAIQAGIFFLFLILLVTFDNPIQKMMTMIIPSLNLDMAHLMIPLFMGGFFWQISLLLHKPLELMERTRYMLIFMLVAVALNILGNTQFISLYGSIATAYTNIATALVYNLLVLIVSLKFWLSRAL